MVNYYEGIPCPALLNYLDQPTENFLLYLALDHIRGLRRGYVCVSVGNRQSLLGIKFFLVIPQVADVIGWQFYPEGFMLQKL